MVTLVLVERLRSSSEHFEQSCISFADRGLQSALEGANVLFTYHPKEEADAKDTVDDIKKRVPKAKVEAVAVEIQTEKACFELADKIKKWSGNELHVL